MFKKFALTLALGLSMSGLAQAQADFPNKPARIIVPYTPGGNTDMLGRVVAQGLGEKWGVSVVVENRPGAGGTIGVEQVARSKPDGYTFVLGAFGNILVARSLFPNVGYSPVEDLTPIVLLATPPLVLVAHPDAPFNDVGGLIRFAKQNPGKLNYGSSGPGTSNHLSAELFAAMADVKLVHVPYKGSAASVSDTVGGFIQLNFAPYPLVKEHLKSGRLKALAVTAAKRSPLLPDVPTIAEAGVPDYEAVGWFGLLAPKDTPDALVQRVNQDVNDILQSQEVRQLLSNEGAVPAGGSSDEARQSILTEEEKWRVLIEKLGIKL
ncbi:MAG: tripartite tricarboxylate transporter substrate binding protein [Pigmentiphaga sp.]